MANLSRSAQAVELNLAPFAGRVPVEMLGGSAFPPIGQLPYLLTLAPHGFHWFELAEKARMPSWYAVPPEPLPEYATFVLRGNLAELMEELPRRRLEREVLPAYLPRRRWFAGKNQALQEVRIDEVIPVPHADREMVLLQLCVNSGDHVDRYLLPLGLLAENEIVSALPQQLALARVRRGAKVSLLTDAMTIEAQSVRGIKPTLTVSSSGLSEPAANTPPLARPVNDAAAPALSRLRRFKLVSCSVVIIPSWWQSSSR